MRFRELDLRDFKLRVYSKRHKYYGFVTKVYRNLKEVDIQLAYNWFNLQKPVLTEDYKNRGWVYILIDHNGGSAVSPIHDIECRFTEDKFELSIMKVLLS